MSGLYATDEVFRPRKSHTDPSFGILANAFGGPLPSMIDTESDLMLRTTVLSRCGVRPATSKVTSAEVKKHLQGEKMMPVPATSTNSHYALPQTEYLHRAHKACTPVSRITMDRISDASILLVDPMASTHKSEFYMRPMDVATTMKDAFRRCERAQPQETKSVFQ